MMHSYFRYICLLNFLAVKCMIGCFLPPEYETNEVTHGHWATKKLNLVAQ